MGEQQPSARDLVRKRRPVVRPPDTGRHHHMGAAPGRQPLLGDAGVSYVDNSLVQLASRTTAQLRAQRERVDAGMLAAARARDYERAAQLRDGLVAIDAELARR